MSASAESFIPFKTEHLINTRFDLLTVLCLRMDRERVKNAIPVLDLIVASKE